MTSSRLITAALIIGQLILLGIELGTRYDSTQRQIALALTNVGTTAALLFFQRWLSRRGQGLSVITIIFVTGAIWLDALGNFQHLYAGYWWWDRLTHTVGGMALSAGFIDLFLAFRRSGKLQAGWSWAAWMGVLVGQLVGSIYEISEWLGDYWFDTHRVTGLYDVPHDLFQNLVGGLMVIALMFIIRKQRLPLESD